MLILEVYLNARRMHAEQNLCPQGVCIGSLWARRQIGHSNLLSNGGSNLASNPSMSETENKERERERKREGKREI